MKISVMRSDRKKNHTSTDRPALNFLTGPQLSPSFSLCLKHPLK